MRALGRTRRVTYALSLAGAALAALTLVSSATAVQPENRCLVVNHRTDARYPTLQAANDALQTSARDTVVVKGTCVGATTFSKSITVAGQSNPAFGIATLDGDGDGTVVIVGPGIAVAISGLTITGGNGDSSSVIHPNGNSGGGIFNAGSLTLRSVVVRNNTAGNGGGIYNLGALTVMDSAIADNTASTDEPPADFVSYEGGGIFNGGCHPYIGCPSDASATISSSLVVSNTGGGIVNGYGGSLALDGATVANNTAGIGAGVASHGQVSVSTSAIVDNAATGGSGGGVYVGRFGGITITDSTVSNNHATDSGGGLAVFLAGLHLNGTTVSGNTATNLGGGILSSGGFASLVGSAVTGNRVTSPAGHGGGVYSEDAGLTLEGSTVTGNIPDDIFYGPL